MFPIKKCNPSFFIPYKFWRKQNIAQQWEIYYIIFSYEYFICFSLYATPHTIFTYIYFKNPSDLNRWARYFCCLGRCVCVLFFIFLFLSTLLHVSVSVSVAPFPLLFHCHEHYRSFAFLVCTKKKKNNQKKKRQIIIHKRTVLALLAML